MPQQAEFPSTNGAEKGMSDWADFCEIVGIDMNDPDQFDA